jgi:hypothetical protein
VGLEPKGSSDRRGRPARVALDNAFAAFVFEGGAISVDEALAILPQIAGRCEAIGVTLRAQALF